MRVRTRDTILEAVQYRPGVPIKGVTEELPRLIISKDNLWFTIDSNMFSWGGTGSWVSIKGQESRPHQLSGITRGESRPALPGDPLVEKFICLVAKQPLPDPVAFIGHRDHGWFIKPSDWVFLNVVHEADNFCSDRFFRNYFTVVE